MKATKSIAKRINAQITVLVLQNGYGVIEELIENLWPNAMPLIIFVAVNRNSIEHTSKYNIYHHSGHSNPDAIRIGQFPIKGQPQANNCFLIQKILQVPELHAALLPWLELLSRLYKKPVINACVNPLAAVLVCNNGELIKEGNNNGTALIEPLLFEAHVVLGDSIPGETYESLLKMVLNILHETKDYLCSTLQDVKAKRLTEINYINGYICKLGLKKNINAKTNEIFVSLVHFKELLYDQQ